MKRKISIFIILTMLLSMLPMVCMGASGKVEIIFSETFEGDLSRWLCEDDREAISISKAEDGYIGSYVHVGMKDKLIKTVPDNIYMKTPSDQCIKSPDIKVQGGETYTFAVDFKYSQQIVLTYYNEEKTLYRSVTYTTTAGKNDQWCCFSEEIHPPVGATLMRIELWTKESGASFDNVLLCKGKVGFNRDIERRKIYAPLAFDDSNTVLEENCVFYETFEKGKTDWTEINEDSSKKAKISADEVATGIKSLYVIDDMIEAPVGIDSKAFEVIPGAEYTLSFKAINNGGSGLNTYIRFLNEENKLVGSKSVASTANRWTSGSVSVVAPDEAKTAQVRIMSKDTSGKNYIDNVKVVMSKPAPEKVIEEPKISKYDEISKNSLQLFIGSPNAIVNGEKTLIDVTNDKVVATIVDSRTLVPVRFIAENYGADVLWDDSTKTVTLKLPDKTVTIVLNENQINIDGKVVEIDVPAQSIEGRTMLPLRAFVSEVMNKNVFWDDRGLIVITDEPVLNAQEDIELINNLIKDIM